MKKFSPYDFGSKVFLYQSLFVDTTINALIRRTYKISAHWLFLHNHINISKQTFVNNSYPNDHSDKILNDYLHKLNTRKHPNMIHLPSKPLTHPIHPHPPHHYPPPSSHPRVHTESIPAPWPGAGFTKILMNSYLYELGFHHDWCTRR